MLFEPPLQPARLLRRYKRFLSDIRLETGEETTAHCPNPGAMTGLADPGSQIWVQDVRHRGGKMPYSWKLNELEGGHFAGIDTGLPNRIVQEALSERRIKGLDDFDSFQPEQRYGQNSRIDFLLTRGAGKTYVEVKNVHLVRKPGLAEFPDSVTARGAKHLRELAEVAQSGHRAVMLYVIQRTDCTAATLARDIDPAYCVAYAAARDAGVQTLAVGTSISPDGVAIASPIPFLWPE